MFFYSIIKGINNLFKNLINKHSLSVLFWFWNIIGQIYIKNITTNRLNLKNDKKTFVAL